jgi:hypothetical protein
MTALQVAQPLAQAALQSSKCGTHPLFTHLFEVHFKEVAGR